MNPIPQHFIMLGIPSLKSRRDDLLLKFGKSLLFKEIQGYAPTLQRYSVSSRELRSITLTGLVMPKCRTVRFKTPLYHLLFAFLVDSHFNFIFPFNLLWLLYCFCCFLSRLVLFLILFVFVCFFGFFWFCLFVCLFLFDSPFLLVCHAVLCLCFFLQF